jgi:GGDEF domain-containing protein
MPGFRVTIGTFLRSQPDKGTRKGRWVAVREAGHLSPPGEHGGLEGDPRALRARWRAVSLATGWRFPSDWGLPEVDTVCSSVSRRDIDLTDALLGLGRARAQSGAGLDETIKDLAALHAVMSSPPDGLLIADPDELPTRFLRTVALGWAEVTAGDNARRESTEPLTGLATAEYLRTRLGEVYRRGRRVGRHPCDEHVLLAVVLDLTSINGFTRVMAMVLVADALRTVFDGGESVAVLGQSVAAVLSERGEELPDRVSRARFLLAERLGMDADLTSVTRPRVRTYRLPPTHSSAVELVNRLAKA